ncbi:MAG: class I SAM-dependent methyltransferase [Pseudomonadota bacterium]
MPEYDEFAEAYEHWSVTASPYGVVETHTFFEVLGSVRGLDVLDLACGAGRTSRMLMERGAASVLGVDVSPEMVRRATERNAVQPGTAPPGSHRHWPTLRFTLVDATDGDFQLEPQVDVVTAMYLFHYASSVDDLEKMARLITRNLKPGGRFVTYTLSPDYDFGRSDPRLLQGCGFEYTPVGNQHCQLVIGGDRVNCWQWSRAQHEDALGGAGLVDVRWHPLDVPADASEVRDVLGFYLADPSCILLSGAKPR